MQRGEIWWASLPEPEGSGPGYRRPVLIIRANEFNRSKIHTVIVAVITSNLALALAPGNVHLSSRSSGLPKESVVNISQLVTIDKGFLTERIRSIDPHKMKEVESGIRTVLAI
ncbi:MAG TPA: mRNA interferase MazF2 [Lentisphaeria bacterium]|nr:MAG: mRNA interferase MazF2 [Lentisphaerae bacterium GWF2_50_93]HCE46612.1 mRNA interferase MazF2 [Lentisphaeria bacterium]